VVGGEAEGGEFDARAAELYDPGSNTWRRTAPLPTALEFHSATRLADGRVLVVGAAFFGPSARSAHVFDPATGGWSAAAAPPASIGTQHQAVRLADGRVLVAGGYCCDRRADPDPSATALYNPATDSWVSGARMQLARWADSMTLTALPDGRALITGGTTISLVSATDRAEVYEPATNAWSEAAPLRDPRYFHTATLLGDGRLLVVGGSGPRPAGSQASVRWAMTEWYNYRR
jgi:hypothetical protein